MLTHQPPVRFFQFGVAAVPPNVEDRVGLIQRQRSRCPGRRRLAVVNPRANEVLDLLELCPGDAQPLTNGLKDFPLPRVNPTVRVGRVELDLDEHAQKMGTAATLPAKLIQHAIEGEIRSLAFAKKAFRELLHVGIEPQLVHDLGRHGDFVRGNPAVGLGEVAHDAEGGGEKGHLGLLPAVVAGPGRQLVVDLHAAVETVAQRGADQQAERTPEHEAEGSSQHFSPPAHVVSSRHAFRYAVPVIKSKPEWGRKPGPLPLCRTTAGLIDPTSMPGRPVHFWHAFNADDILQRFIRTGCTSRPRRPERRTVFRVAVRDRDHNMSEPSSTPTSVGDLMKLAVSSHQAGNLAVAEGLYKQILAKEPEQADALHLLGLAAHQQGRNADAESLIQRAIREDADRAYFHNNLGEVRRASGNPAGAESCYREALRLDPRYAQAYNNLGLALHDLGRLKESEAAFRSALEIEPDSGEVHNNLGIAQQSLGRLDEAEASFRKSLDIHPAHAEACNNLGAVLRLKRQFEKAAGVLEEAVRLHPNLMRAHYNLAAVRIELGDPDAAESAARRAVELGPAEADCHTTLGQVLRRRGDLAGAEASFRQALELNPRHPTALNDLGVLLLVGGAFEEAASYLRRAIDADPDLAMAYENLARTRKFSDQDLDDIELLEAQLKCETLDTAARTHIHFALGKVRDDLGQYDEAFRHFAEANALKRDGLHFSIDDQKQFVDDTIDTFDAEFISRLGPMSDPTEVPVFIIGMLRSGTTLVEQILASHPDVHGAGEVEYFRDLSAALPDRLQDTRRYPLCLEAMHTDLAREITDQYLALLQRKAPDALRVCDKMPLNFEHLGLIAGLFPNARIIHCRRNPLDVCVSIFAQHFPRDVPFAYELGDIAGYYREYERLMAHWRKLMPGRIFEVEYEELVAKTDSISRELVGHCGLKWDDRCLRFYETERNVGTASHWQVRQPVYRDSVARWKRYESDLEPLFSVFGPVRDGRA